MNTGCETLTVESPEQLAKLKTIPSVQRRIKERTPNFILRPTLKQLEAKLRVLQRNRRRLLDSIKNEFLTEKQSQALGFFNGQIEGINTYLEAITEPRVTP